MFQPVFWPNRVTSMSPEVRQQPLRRLVGQLDRALQEADGDARPGTDHDTTRQSHGISHGTTTKEAETR